MKFRFAAGMNGLSLALALAMAPASVISEPHDHSHHQHDKSSRAGEMDPHAHHRTGGEGEIDPHAHHKAMLEKPAEPATSAEVDLKDLALVDQDGNEVRFVNDVIGDRIVVMDFVYTSCTTVCPVLSALFGQVQERLGEQLGKEVVLVSVSVDPTRDTPQRLKAYAARHQAKPGWIWLTGAKTRMDEVLDGLGAYTPNFEDHPSMVLVGDGRTGKWSRFFGFPSPDRIVEQVDAMQAMRQSLAGG